MNSEIRLNVAGLVYNQSVVGTYGLVLAELEGKRRFSVMIGEPEAQSIAMKMNHKVSPRPLTHDLIITLITSFGARVEKVVIYDMVNDVFYSELYLKKGDNTMVVDARTSDAIAIAVRAECPIFIREEILRIVGMEVETTSKESNDTDDTDEKEINAEDLSIEELVALPIIDLEELLEMALKEERYELAVNLRDAILRKKRT